jgi:16S rRNA (uracil1498-N3)-methyltransferase
MHCFYCTASEIGKDHIVITDGGKRHHMKNALRMRQGEGVTVFDEHGAEYQTVVDEITPDHVRLLIKEKKAPSSPAAHIRLAVACALPKNVKMDDIVDKLTQLGVDVIIPMRTERVIVAWDEKKQASHIQRWERIALNASQQSRRRTLPVIEAVRDFPSVVAMVSQYESALIPCLEGERKFLKDVLASSQARSILVMIGPEGDFSPSEIAAALEAGCVPVTLGERVLRVDTACAAVAACIRLYDQR